MKERKRYMEHSGLKGATHLEISTYYTKGGTNYFSGNPVPRGYYLSVKPVTKAGGTISYDLFSGQKMLMFETTRFTTKQFERAVAMAVDYEEKLITAVITDNQAA